MANDNCKEYLRQTNVQKTLKYIRNGKTNIVIPPPLVQRLLVKTTNEYRMAHENSRRDFSRYIEERFTKSTWCNRRLA